MPQEKIILFGGSFDPVHRGHLEVAQAAKEALDAARVIFIPAKRSPLKDQFPTADASDRLEMIRLAIAGRPGFEVSDCELKRPDPSYTLDTVREFREKLPPQTVLYWLVGADAVRQLPHWYRVHELLELCEFAVMYRAGYSLPDFSQLEGQFSSEQVDRLRRNVVAVPLIDISSTEVRRRLESDEPTEDLLPGAVCKYIQAKGLYQNR